MSKATDVLSATEGNSNTSHAAAELISQLINARPTSPSVSEIEAIINTTVPIAPGVWVKYDTRPARNDDLATFLRLEEENRAAWLRAEQANFPDEIVNGLDDELHTWMEEFWKRPVKSWADVAVLGAIALYWYRCQCGADYLELLPGLGADECEDTKAHAYLLTAIAKITGRGDRFRDAGYVPGLAKF
jgi:hypothetical protein